MASGKAIRIRCEGTEALPLDDLCDLQGTLKVLTDENAAKLRESILRFGFSFPVFVWGRAKRYIVDGHQRVEVLKRLRDEGYEVPDIPVVPIHASSKAEARKKLLTAVSQYGDVSVTGLADMLDDMDAANMDLSSVVAMPGIDLSGFFESLESDGIPVTDGVAPVAEDTDIDTLATSMECPKCGYRW